MMLKLFGNILLALVMLLLTTGSLFAAVEIDVNYGGGGSANNVSIGGGARSESDAARNNDKLQNFESDGFVSVARGGEAGLYNSMVQFARDLKNLFYAIATVYFLIISIKLIMASNSEEEWGNWKKGVIWITIGIVFMQIAYAVTLTVFDQGVSAHLGVQLMEHVVKPLIKLLQTLTAPLFIALTIYEFYRLITSNGNEEARKKSIMAIIYGMIGFMLVKFAQRIVEAFYGKIDCESYDIGFLSFEGSACINESNLSRGAGIILEIIKWMNGFVAIAVMVMIIYAGFSIIFANGDEEKLKKGKRALVYIGIGMLILVTNYLIVTFFFRPETII